MFEETKEEREKRLKSLQEYLGLEDEQQAALYDLLEIELGAMGEWGEKILTYLKSILSRNKRYKTYVQKEDLDLYRKLLEDSKSLLKLELDKYKNDDNI